MELDALQSPWPVTAGAAILAYLEGSLPIAASIVVDNRILATAVNRTQDHIIEHAETRAIRSIDSRADLARATMYTTMEPCPMCTGAIRMAKLQSLVIGATDPAAGDSAHLGDSPFMSHFGCRVEGAGDTRIEFCFATLLIETRQRMGKTRWNAEWAMCHPAAYRTAQELLADHRFDDWQRSSASADEIWREIAARSP